jgi:hypothetical protein
MLELAQSNQPALINQVITPLLPEVTQKRRIGPGVLKYQGADGLLVERCFEWTLPAAEKFLRWLIQNPDRMTWPQGGKKVYKLTTQLKRAQLFGRYGIVAAEAAQREALAELERLGAGRGHVKWWAFEGITHVDCYLETRDLVLLIEGKRTETLSAKTDWYPARNQLVRNLEVAQEIAGNKNYAVLVIAENDFGPIPAKVVEQSLPNFSQAEREALIQHYLGCILWKDVCRGVEIAYESLPDTVSDYVNRVSW